MEKYTKYNNMAFDSFDIDRILKSMDNAQGFLLSTVFQKKFSMDINLKRHEDMKNWISSKELPYLVLDGVQKVSDPDSGKILDYSILYILTFFRDDKISIEGFQDLAQILLKRYDLNTIITKLPNSNNLETWNREAERKAFRNITSTTTQGLTKDFFLGLNKKKEKFFFVGIENQSEDAGPFIRKVKKRDYSDMDRQIA
ncbi:hypothetical protein [Leptospira sp. GIMC2001]|uniref:hypothetical protein n=1 Tax=Leptospira sp. GIMC2001 TaxID=1513297 RepID=UPI00234B1640|nr:hypothetical protein [Leptospira sp. GIMC2001]WCL49687.1 hypothetical protein O4O04_02385 [Leptospira sp. GIMC2001]